MDKPYHRWKDISSSSRPWPTEPSGGRDAYVIRIREAGTGQWNFGFETPIPGCTFVDLKPDAEYELQIRAKGVSGEGEPVYITTRTSATCAEHERGDV